MKRAFILVICILLLFGTTACNGPKETQFDYTLGYCKEVKDVDELKEQFRGELKVPEPDGYEITACYAYKEIMAVIKYENSKGQVCCLYTYFDEALLVGEKLKAPSSLYRDHIGRAGTDTYETSVGDVDVWLYTKSDGVNGTTGKFFAADWFGWTQTFCFLPSEEMNETDFLDLIDKIGADKKPAF